MVWSSTWPVGTVAVGDNTLTGQANTTYVETTMNVDHYWNIGGDEDGHHKFVQCPKTETGGTPSNPTVATGMDGALYLKQKTTVESPDFQAVLPYFKDGLVSPSILEMLGIRSCGLVTIGASPTFTIVSKYSHNLTSITRQSAGVYDVVFPQLPSQYYLPFVMALRRGSAGQSAYATLDGTLKTDTGFRILVQRTEITTTRTDPQELWFFVFGG
jgi:hypothetical protein